MHLFGSTVCIIFYHHLLICNRQNLMQESIQQMGSYMSFTMSFQLVTQNHSMNRSTWYHIFQPVFGGMLLDASTFSDSLMACSALGCNSPSRLLWKYFSPAQIRVQQLADLIQASLILYQDLSVQMLQAYGFQSLFGSSIAMNCI